MAIQSLLNHSMTLSPAAPVANAPQLATPPSKTPNSSRGSPKWCASDIATALEDFYLEVKASHAEMVAHGLEATHRKEWRTHHGADVFASLSSSAVPEVKDKTMRVKFKQHLKGKKDQREEHHKIVCVKTKVPRVPRYRFHHVEIKKNVLTPNTMLTFVPHLRDLESNEETKYNRWLKELEDIDLKSGFKPMNREEKVVLTIQNERSAAVSLYLESWLDRLAIPHCNKSALIAYMASREPDDAMTPQQKSDILRSHREANGDNNISPEARRAAAMFTEGFKKAFQDDLQPFRRVDLRKILLLDETVDGILESKPTAKDGSSAQLGDEDEIAESNLATYTILGCLICFSHSCDHGEQRTHAPVRGPSGASAGEDVVVLNRECDPELCLSCGVAERADPHNSEEQWLHATGCQNCDLQRGVSKSLMLGQSQLEGCGYGLFTAEDIAQDDFVIEYVGELITHDEGVRREARRGDVFDEDSNISYVFTLLENEGIWVDAAIYGNLSRYINHASEHDRRGCNITPRILYVNGEYRIKFTAIRDIEAGEELFFNYGENFPNLTKKLLDTKAGEKPEMPRKPGRPRQSQTSDKVARKAPKQEQKKPGRKKGRPGRPPAAAAHALKAETGQWQNAPANPRKRKRNMDDDSEEDDYHPSKTDEVGTESGHDGDAAFKRAQRQARPGLRARASASETPTKRTDRQKTRGKRGGARPGSGRPRKHPRPAPKPTPEHSGMEQQSPARSFLTTSPEGLTGSPRANRRGRGAQARTDVSVIQDSQDDSANDADEDDQDVMVRKRTDRAARNRRPPAKFRDDEL
ncbi:hypothetical protein K4F52_003680 [Lecanicillium sp. MT-2017a]|nr:hypothetical protein K4F52_003680 [Lecanicillium sp. MT-2017a]